MFRTVAMGMVSRLYLPRTAPYSIAIAPKKTASVIFSSFVRAKHEKSGLEAHQASKQSSVAELSNKPIHSDEDVEDKKSLEGLARDDLNLQDSDYESLANEAMHVTESIQSDQNVLVIQPYIKWGPEKSATPPDLKLQEAECLIRSLDTWSIQESVQVGLDSFDKPSLFGRGKLKELLQISKKYNNNLDKKISRIFVSTSVLTQRQKENLEKAFLLPVMDRFSVVIQILRLHAKSRESKLQVALAEIPYLCRQLGREFQITRCKLVDSQHMMLRNREKRIKSELANVRKHQQTIRNKRMQWQFPTIAVVGYTNAGKTSLIRALTQEWTMQPRNRLFATLDITAHGGILPCNLNVIYMDTIGFMSDIPTGLLECFVATLKDAMFADLIIHVQDVSHPNYAEQRKHVEETLETMFYDPNDAILQRNIMNVGNKCDLVSDLDQIRRTYGELKNDNATGETMHFISSTQMTGLHDLTQAIQRNILQVTERKKVVIRVPQGGLEMPWLFKNTAVVHTEADPKDCEFIFVHSVLSDLELTQFKNTFLSRKALSKNSSKRINGK